MSERPYRGKRLLDLGLVVVSAPAWGLLAIACALAVGLTSGRPILFRQERVGLGGRTFAMLKFRTMRTSPVGNDVFPDPAAITPIGRLLRTTSLDELPQLLNVAIGEMSVVGPRPALQYQVDRYTPEQRRRLLVRPGLTGLAQIRGRNSIPWDRRIAHDIEYLGTQSVGLDLRILLQTVVVLGRREGVGGHPTDDAIAVPPKVRN
jgi:lipopolysaccharide/colanic/teichoic acid biosynthesis glycosyltransferase